MIKDKKVLAITLARKGSKGIDNKNVVYLGGKPLVQWTMDEAKKSKYIDRYIVSSNIPGIEDIDPDVEIFWRSDEFASDTASSADALIEVIGRQTEEYDIIVELMATNPFKTVEDIDKCIEMLVDDPAACGVTAVSRVREYHPQRLKTLCSNGYMKDIWTEVPESRRQDLQPEVYIRAGSIYVMYRYRLQEMRQRYYSFNNLAYILPPERAINIDTKDDLSLAMMRLLTND